MFESTFAALRQRLKSPLLGSFILTWSVINWKFFVIMFFGDGVETRLDQVGRFVLSQGYTNTLYCPAFYAVLYTITAPLFKSARKLYGHWQAIWIENLKKKLDKQIQYTGPEYRAAVKVLEDQHTELGKDFKTYMYENPTLDDAVQKYITDFHELLLEMSEKHAIDRNTWISNLSTQHGIRRNEAEMMLRYLRQKNLIEDIVDDKIAITHQGRMYVYNHLMQSPASAAGNSPGAK